MAGVHSLIFATRLTASGREVRGIKSSDGEVVEFDQEIGFDEHGHTAMETWFSDLV